MSRTRLILLVNDAPWLKRKKPPLDRIRRLVGTTGLSGTSHVDIELAPTYSLSEVEVLARRIVEDPPDHVALWGGDGTVTALLTALVQAYGDRPVSLPRMCILPAGTMNANAHGLGLRRRPLHHLERLVTLLAAGESVPEVTRTVIRAGGRAGFLFGIGLIPNYLAVYESTGDGGVGPALLALAESAKSLFTGVAEDRFFRGFEAVVHADGAPFCRGRFTDLSAGGTESLPFGFKTFPRAAEAPGKFHFVAHALSARTAALELLPVRAGRGIKRARQGVFERVDIQLDHPEPINFDGDTFEAHARITLQGGLVARLTLPK